MRIGAITLICLMAWLNAFADTPYVPIYSNFELGSDKTQWSIVTKQFNTPVVRCYLYQGTNAWDATGWTAVFKFGKSQSSTNLHSVTGTVYTNYVDFQIASNTFTTAFDNWYSTVLLTSSTLNVSQASGLLTIKKAPELR